MKTTLRILNAALTIASLWSIASVARADRPEWVCVGGGAEENTVCLDSKPVKKTGPSRFVVRSSVRTPEGEGHGSTSSIDCDAWTVQIISVDGKKTPTRIQPVPAGTPIDDLMSKVCRTIQATAAR